MKVIVGISCRINATLLADFCFYITLQRYETKSSLTFICTYKMMKMTMMKKTMNGLMTMTLKMMMKMTIMKMMIFQTGVADGKLLL